MSVKWVSIVRRALMRCDGKAVIHTESRNASGRPPPPLPTEIWRVIFKFAIGLGGAATVDLPQPNSNGRHEEDSFQIDSGLFQDQVNLSHVSSFVRALTTEIAVEYLVIETGQQLAYYARLFTHSERRLGAAVRRLDLHILDTYKIKHLVALLKHAPNLLVLVNRNYPSTTEMWPIPTEVMSSITTYGRNIQRLEFHSPAEAPTFFDLIDISRHLRKLKTLHLRCIHSYPTNPQVFFTLPPLVFINLRTLSLGLIPVPPNQLRRVWMAWDPLLLLLCLDTTTQLPSLTRFETDLFPSMALKFFEVQGPKLQTLRTATSSISPDSPLTLSVALQRCPNLENLTLSGSCRSVTLPSHHPAIQRICITPLNERRVNVPSRVFLSAVVNPIDELLMKINENFDAPLKEVRLRNVGSFLAVEDHALWLEGWWRRWNIRGIKFVDKVGKEYKDFQPDRSQVLETLRE